MAKNKPEAPDVQYIKSLLSSCETTYQDDDEQIRSMRKVREMAQPVGIPDDLVIIPVEIRDPTVADEVFRVTASLAKHPPTWRCVSGSPADEAVEAATRIEMWTEETLLRNAGTRTPGEDTWRFAVDACVGDGGAWTKLLHTPDTWEERYDIRWAKYAKAGKSEDQFIEDVEIAKKRAGPPFLWKAVDSLTVYPVWEGGTIAEVVEVYTRDTMPLARKYGMVPHYGAAVARDYAAGLSHVGRWIEHHDAYTTTYMCEGGVYGDSPTLLKQFEHHMGRHPYFYAPGLMMNHWRGRKTGWGVSQTKRWLSELRSLLYTLAVQDMGKQLGSPMFIERPETAEAIIGKDGSEVETKDMLFKMNRLIELSPGMKYSNGQTAPVSPAIKEMLAYVSAMINEVNTPRPTNEIGSALAGAGFAVSQVLAEVMTKHDPYVKSLSRMMEEVTEFLWHLTSNLSKRGVEERVYAKYETRDHGKTTTKWVGVSKQDLAKIVAVHVDIDPQDDSAKLVETRIHTELITAGRLSIDQAIELEGRDPDVVRLGIVMDQMRKEDWYKATQVIEMMQSVGHGDLIPQAALMAATTGMIPGASPELQRQIMAQRQLATAQQQANQQGSPQAQPQSAMGSPQVPDMGRAAGGPGAPQGQPSAPPGPQMGPGPGMGMPSTPAQSAAPGIGR